MMDEHGELLGRAIETLRELPEVRTESTARLLIAVAAERQREAERGQIRHVRRWMAGAAVAAAAAVVIALSLLPSRRRHDAAVVASTDAAPSAVPAVPVSSGNADVANSARPVQFVLSAPGAHSVRVVGDFNGWDDRQSPMVRDAASGLWSTSLILRPGRHVYAFVVNDTQWVRDPRTPSATDVDFGRPGSVLLVGRP